MSIALLASFAVVAWLVRGQIISTNRLKKPHSILKKILVNHLQQTALMLNFDLSWPDPLKGSLASADTASSAGQELASPDCFRAQEIPNAPGSASPPILAVPVHPDTPSHHKSTLLALPT